MYINMLKKIISLLELLLDILKPKTSSCQHIDDYVEDFSTIVNTKTVAPVDWKIYYWVEWYSNDFSKVFQNVIFNNMFTYWQDILKPIIFVRTKDLTKAQIKIYWRKNWDSDLPVEFKDTTIAYAFWPYGGEHAGKMYINDDKAFSHMESQWWYWLLKVLVHESGHLLNISHSNDSEDIMYYAYQRWKQINVTKDTIDGLKNLYNQYL